jgi:WD40 repeat protein
MSGGPVVTDGMLLGVVNEHAPREGSKAITAIPLTALEHDPAHPGWGDGVRDPAAWWARLGVTNVESLHLVPGALAPPVAAPVGLIDFAQERARHTRILAREQVFETLHGWIEGALTGWILVKGGPGTGKSAILSAMLDQLEARYGPETVPYHLLRRGQGNWNEPDAVVRNLIARLERICGHPDQTATPGLERLYALIVEAAARMAEAGNRLVLVVDGLDEAAAAGDGDGGPALSRFLPASLPEDAFILCASRPNYPELGWLEQRSRLRTIDLDQPPWVEDNDRLVAAFWADRGPRLKPPLEQDVLDAAVAAAQGNILHAVTLYDAFEADTQARDPKRVPVGFAALLEDMWLRLVELKDRAASGQALDGLGLLAIAGEALPLSTVAQLLDWTHPADVAAFKRHALPFLLEEEAEWHGGEARYRPFHESTREFLTSGEHMSPNVRRRWHELLARRLAAWPPAADATPFDRQYAARYALMHLVQTRDWARISELLQDLHYVVAALMELGPHLLLGRIAEQGEGPATERATVLRRILRKESQWLERHPNELPSLVHNQLTCLGWDRDRIRATFSGLDHGWGLVKAVDVGNELCILRGHTSHVTTCDIDARGRYAVSGGWDGTLRVWDLDRGSDRLVVRLDPKADRCDVKSCAISQDGRYVVAASIALRPDPPRERRRMQVLSTTDGLPVLDVEYPYGPEETGVAFAAGHVLVASIEPEQVDVYDIERETRTRLSLDGAIGGAIDVDVSGTLVAAITATGCGVWRLRDGGEQCTVPFPSARWCSFSPDGGSIAVATDSQVLIADARDGSIAVSSSLPGHLSDCRLLDSRRLLYTSDWDCSVVVWDPDGDRTLATYEGHTYSADRCAVTPDSLHALSGGGDDTVRLWSLAEHVELPPVERHAKLVYDCTIDAAATLACSGPQDDVPAVWNARTGTRLGTVPANVQYGRVRFCEFAGRLGIAALGDRLSIFDPETAQRVWEAEIPVRDQYGEISWLDSGGSQRSPEGVDGRPHVRLPLLYAGSHVVLWQEGRALQPIAIPDKAQVSPLHSGRALATLRDGMLEVMDLDRTDVRRTVAEGVRAFAGSPTDYAIYVVAQDGRVCRLAAESGEVSRTLGEVEHETVTLKVDAQESALWAICRNGGEWWQAPIDEALIAFPIDDSGIAPRADITGHQLFDSCFLSGRLITAGWDATIRIWDPRGPMPFATISGSAPFRCVDAAQDRVVAGDQRGNVWILAPMRDLYPET